MSKLKVYIVGGNSLREIDWIQNVKLVDDFHKADVIHLMGGQDWNTEYYNQKPNSHVYNLKSRRDEMEMYYIKKAIKEGKFINGTCRGLQGICIAAGGSLIQHIMHPSSHTVYTKFGTEYVMNSCHHQMVYPWSLPEDHYDVLSYTLDESPFHLGEDDKEVEFPPCAYENGILKEPEVVWFPKIKALGTQGHFEWMSNHCEGNKFINEIIQELFIKEKVNI